MAVVEITRASWGRPFLEGSWQDWWSSLLPDTVVASPTISCYFGVNVGTIVVVLMASFVVGGGVGDGYKSRGLGSDCWLLSPSSSEIRRGSSPLSLSFLTGRTRIEIQVAPQDCLIGRNEIIHLKHYSPSLTFSWS